MSFHPSVRIVEEGSGNLIAECPGFFSLPRVDDTLSLTLNGASQVDYKVEGVRYVVDTFDQFNASGQLQRVNVNGFVYIEVSVI